VPPTFSGYPAADRSGWEAFRGEFRRTHAELHADFDAFCRDRGAPALSELEFVHDSPYLNLYLYPDEVDYPRARPLDGRWHNLQASVRDTDAPWEPPAGDGPLIYLSLGSLGSGDVELMRTLIATLADVPARIVVSKGPQHDQLELAPTMTGAEFLPQVSILPHADLVITHGGNNTVTECLRFGRPTVILPLFWDQYDNAQRLHETGFGIRLDTYRYSPEELTGAIDRLLADGALRARLAQVSSRLAQAPGTVTAADLIERAARDHQ
jgi:MGT family glycosyltransferase